MCSAHTNWRAISHARRVDLLALINSTRLVANKNRKKPRCYSVNSFLNAALSDQERRLNTCTQTFRCQRNVLAQRRGVPFTHTLIVHLYENPWCDWNRETTHGYKFSNHAWVLNRRIGGFHFTWQRFKGFSATSRFSLTCYFALTRCENERNSTRGNIGWWTPFVRCALPPNYFNKIFHIVKNLCQLQKIFRFDLQLL